MRPPLRQTASVEYHFYPHYATPSPDDSYGFSGGEKQGTRRSQCGLKELQSMAHISLCIHYEDCWKLGYGVSGNSFGRVRLQGFLCLLLVVYVALCCATLLPVAFQFQLPTALLPVKRSWERI